MADGLGTADGLGISIGLGVVEGAAVDHSAKTGGTVFIDVGGGSDETAGDGAEAVAAVATALHPAACRSRKARRRQDSMDDFPIFFLMRIPGNKILCVLYHNI